MSVDYFRIWKVTDSYERFGWKSLPKGSYFMVFDQYIPYGEWIL